MKKELALVVSLVVLGALSRLVPHGWNFTAIGAVAVVSGLLITSNRLTAILTPLTALFVSDLFIDFHDTMIYVYGAYALSVGVGMLFSKQQQFKNIILGSVVGSLLFFMISNFGVWMSGTAYTPDMSGLMNCYVMGVPFYRNQFLSDLILTPILFYSAIYFKVHLLNFSFLSSRKNA